MAEQGVLYAQKLYVRGRDLSGNMTAGGFECGVEGQDSTRYATALTGTTSKTEDPGLSFAQIEAASLWEAGLAAGSIDDRFAAELRLADVPILFCPLTGAEGERAYLLSAFASQYRAGAKIGEMLKADFSAKCSSLWVAGTILKNGSQSGTGNGTAFQVGAVPAGKSLYAHLHVISGTFGSITVKVQSDDAIGFPSATDRVTFGAAAAVGAEIAVAVPGPITDDYWRMNVSALTSGPMTIVLAIGIR